MKPERFDAPEDLENLKIEVACMEDDYTQEDRSEWKSARVSEIKEKLTLQYLGMAALIDRLRTMVEEDPENRLTLLQEEVDKYASEYQFNSPQKVKILSAIRKYSTRHQAVEAIR